MGFDSRWVDWMMMSVRSMEFHVLVNNKKVKPNIPRRRLR